MFREIPSYLWRTMVETHKTVNQHRATVSRVMAITSVAISTLLALTAVEGVYREWLGVPIFAATNWRARRIATVQADSPAIADPQLGWTMLPWVSGPGFNTLDLGVRSNGLDEPGVRMGSILAVGDSFTAGSDVVDGETWPAHLERLLGVPVVNAGVGGYGTDQIIRRAEQFLPIVRPHTLILGFLDDDILRAEFAIYGRPKPYYRFEGGVLTEHLPGDVDGGGFLPWSGRIKRMSVARLGYSAAADGIMSALAPQLWYLSPDGYVHLDIDGASVTCELLARIGRLIQSRGVRGLVFMQYGGLVYTRAASPPPPARRVLACAQQAGFLAVDQFPTLKAVYRRDRTAFADYYVAARVGLYGHMSSHGNLQAAELLADAIRAADPDVHTHANAGAAPVVLVARTALPSYGDVIPRVASTAHAVLEPITGADHRPTGAYELVARGAGGEHYVAASGLPSPPGRHTVVAEVAPDVTDRVRLQLLDGHSSVALADVDLATGAVVPQAGAALDAHVNTSQLPGGWIRIGISAELPAPGRVIIIQLLSHDGATNFAAHGESVRVRVLRLDP